MRGIDIPLIDTWPELAQDGYLLPQYDIDGMHLSREAALVSLQKIIDCLTGSTCAIRALRARRSAGAALY